MYSTASSDCDDYCTYGTDVYEYESCYGRTPFYPTMGQPLIYYAQMPPSKKQRSRESRKENRNCFAKAFKWYTQEHVPCENIQCPKKSEKSGFANWLDYKYNEFLQNSQFDNVNHLKMQQTNEADTIPKNTCCETARSKRLRVKSPWINKRCISKEAGDVNNKPNQSFQFILQPKDMTRPTSASCQPSNTTVISNEMPTRTTIISQSYTLVSADDYKSENNADTQNKVDNDLENKSQKIASHDMSCQCSLVKVEKINAQSQYNTDAERTTTCGTEKITRNICQTCCELTSSRQITKAPILSKKELPAKQPAVQHEMFCQCHKEVIPTATSKSQCHCRVRETHKAKRAVSISNTQSSSKTGKTCPCESYEKCKQEIPARTPSPIAFSNDGIQTSDYSIHLEKDAELEYPLFMKIVCADKLCK